MTVSYSKPTSGANNKLIDIAGNQVASFSHAAATSDTTPPRVLSGQINGDTITLVFSEALDESSSGGHFRASVQLYNGTKHSFSPSGGVEVKGNKVMIGLGHSSYGTKRIAKAGVTGNLAYYLRKHDSDEGIRDLAGNFVDTPRTWGAYRKTPFIFLENVTGGPPRVTAAQIVSDPGSDATYGLGDTIRVRLTFNQPVVVVGGPRLKIAFDTGIGARLGDVKWAEYESGSGTSKLDFSYTVAEAEDSSNNSTRGIAVLEDSLTLGGGTIRSLASSKDADLAQMGLGHDRNHKVDTPFRLQRAELSGTTLTITFSETLGAASSLANGAFAVQYTAAGGSQETIGLSGSPLISGHTLTLTLASRPPSSGSNVTVSYTKPSTGSGNKLVDTAANELASFSGQSVGADVTPPTLVRGEVNGEMLTLIFNEPLDETAYRNHYFRVLLNIESYRWHEFYFQRDVQISGHRVTVRMGHGSFYSAKAHLPAGNRAYYYKVNDATGPGLRDRAGNEVSILHHNRGYLSTRWVPLENLTGQ